MEVKGVFSNSFLYPIRLLIPEFE